MVHCVHCRYCINTSIYSTRLPRIKVAVIDGLVLYTLLV